MHVLVNNLISFIFKYTISKYCVIILFSFFYSILLILRYFLCLKLGWKIDDRILNILTVTLPPLEKLTTIE